MDSIDIPQRTWDNRSKNKLNLIFPISWDVPQIVTNGRFSTIFYDKQDKTTSIMPLWILYTLRYHNSYVTIEITVCIQTFYSWSLQIRYLIFVKLHSISYMKESRWLQPLFKHYTAHKAIGSHNNEIIVSFEPESNCKCHF